MLNFEYNKPIILKLNYIFIFFILIILIKLNKFKYNNLIFSEKWIVMAVFNPPNLSLIKFLFSLKSWKIVIIECNKNTFKKWKVTINNSHKIIYLSLKKQKKLNYNIIKYLDINSYSRKNIGYLYAISHGAKEIYEIDENIIIKDLKDDYNLNNSKLCYGLRNDSGMINPYSYFGENYIWPRGFIINDIGKVYNNKFYSINFSQLNLKPLIFQGLINEIPDLDSICFLSKYQHSIKYDFSITDYNPIFYFPGNYVPINSKTTKYLYEIFPFLVLPITVNEKISDIIRGYILQRFLWGYNGMVIYHSTSIYNYQNLNGSNFFKEKDLYFKLDCFLKSLNIEKYSKNNDPIKTFIYLIKDLIIEGFLGEKNLYFYKAYLKDILNFGYNYSLNFEFKIKNNYKDYLRIYSEFSIYLPPNPIIKMNTNSIKLFNHYISNQTYNDILLIINYNNKGFQKINNYMLRLYKQYFKNIVFLMPNSINESNIITCKNSYYGHYSYICFKIIYKKYPNFKGYLFINDDDFMKVWELENLDFNIPWLYNLKLIYKKWHHYKNCKRIYKIFNRYVDWKTNITKFLSFFDIPKTIADFYYIPKNIIKQFLEIIEIMYNQKLFLECAVPSSFGILLLPKYQIIYFEGLWGETRKKSINYLIKDYKQITIHPIKFSNKFLIIRVDLYIDFINAMDY